MDPNDIEEDVGEIEPYEETREEKSKNYNCYLFCYKIFKNRSLLTGTWTLYYYVLFHKFETWSYFVFQC